MVVPATVYDGCARYSVQILFHVLVFEFLFYNTALLFSERLV